VVPITHEQTIICSKTRLDFTTLEQTIICRQLFAGHVVGCQSMEGKKKLHRMVIFQYLRDKKKDKKGAQKKGSENSPISPPLDPRLLNKPLFTFFA